MWFASGFLFRSFLYSQGRHGWQGLVWILQNRKRCRQQCAAADVAATVASLIVLAILWWFINNVTKRDVFLLTTLGGILLLWSLLYDTMYLIWANSRQKFNSKYNAISKTSWATFRDQKQNCYNFRNLLECTQSWVGNIECKKNPWTSCNSVKKKVKRRNIIQFSAENVATL